MSHLVCGQRSAGKLAPGGWSVPLRQCPHCGAYLDDSLARCTNCREDITVRPSARVRDPMAGRHQIRRGMMYTWLGAIFYYFTGGYSSLVIPFEVPAFVNDYVLPFMILTGIGLFLYGVILRIRG